MRESTGLSPLDFQESTLSLQIASEISGTPFQNDQERSKYVWYPKWYPGSVKGIIANILRAEASFFSALARKRSICVHSTLCGWSFFIWSDERNAPMAPDVLKESILARPARVKFLSR